MRNQKIISRVVLAVVLFEILIQGVLFFFVSKKISAALENQELEKLQVIAKDRSQIVELYIDFYAYLVDAYSQDIRVTKAIKHPDYQKAIDEFVSYTSSYSRGVESLDGFFVADWEETKIIASDNEDMVGTYLRTGTARQMLKDRM